jgi:hypothetical protein
MNKIFLLIYVILLVGCKEPAQKLLDAYVDKYGEPSSKSEEDKSHLVYIWENVSNSNSDEAFNISDKTLNLLPTKKTHLEEGVMPNDFCSRSYYETPKLKVQIEFIINTTKDFHKLRYHIYNK